MWPFSPSPFAIAAASTILFSIAPTTRDHELRVDVVVVLADEDGGVGLAPAFALAAGEIAVVEAVDPHLRDRQHVERLGERNAAAGVGVAGEQRLEARARELRLEIARDLEDRGPGPGAIGDARDAALEPALVGRLAVLERRRLQPRRVEILHLVAGDDAAVEAADAGIVARAGDVALLRERGREREARRRVSRARCGAWISLSGEMWAARRAVHHFRSFPRKRESRPRWVPACRADEPGSGRVPGAAKYAVAALAARFARQRGAGNERRRRSPIRADRHARACRGHPRLPRLC